jgi:hypothetical protein
MGIPERGSLRRARLSRTFGGDEAFSVIELLLPVKIPRIPFTLATTIPDLCHKEDAFIKEPTSSRSEEFQLWEIFAFQSHLSTITINSLYKRLSTSYPRNIRK